MTDYKLKIKYTYSLNGKLLCGICKKQVAGPEGVVTIMIPNRWDTIKCRCCSDCFNKFIHKFKIKRKTRVKDFNYLLKKRTVKDM